MPVTGEMQVVEGMRRGSKYSVSVELLKGLLKAVEGDLSKKGVSYLTKAECGIQKEASMASHEIYLDAEGRLHGIQMGSNTKVSWYRTVESMSLAGFRNILVSIVVAAKGIEAPEGKAELEVKKGDRLFKIERPEPSRVAELLKRL